MRPQFLALLLVIAGCSGSRPGEVNDPYEPVNRRVHAFNAALDARVIAPAGRALKGSPAPRPRAQAVGQDGPSLMSAVANVGSNLSLPGKVVNHLLQGRPEPAVRNTFRFLINTTLGLAGTMDPAGHDFALPEIDTDFGETLHVWGVPEGAYLELPVLGPSTERDAVGKVVDFVIDPTSRWLTPEQRVGRTMARVAAKIHDRGRFGSTVDQVLHDSADGYAQTRLLYLQHRRHELKQEEEVIDPYE